MSAASRRMLAERIAGGEQVSWTAAPHIDGELLDEEGPTGRRALAREAVNVTRVLATPDAWGEDVPFSISMEDFGPLRLPYDALWIEWPDSTFHGRIAVLLNRDSDELRAMSPKLTELPAFKSERISTNIFYSDCGRDARVILLRDSAVIDVSESGCYETAYRSCADPTARVLVDYAVNIAMFAVGLMNCRNVELDRVAPPGALVKKALKRGRVLLSHNVIRLPSASASRGPSRTSATPAAVPLHLVRGHFKTYTGDAPLFGRLTGTWWWGWTAKGSGEHGVRTKHYDVGLAARNEDRNIIPPNVTRP